MKSKQFPVHCKFVTRHLESHSISLFAIIIRQAIFDDKWNRPQIKLTKLYMPRTSSKKHSFSCKGDNHYSVCKGHNSLIVNILENVQLI